MEQHDHDILVGLVVKVDSLTEKVSVLTDDHEKRIRILESNQEQNKGMDKVTAIFWSAATAVGVFIIEHFLFKK